MASIQEFEQTRPGPMSRGPGRRQNASVGQNSMKLRTLINKRNRLIVARRKLRTAFALTRPRILDPRLTRGQRESVIRKGESLRRRIRLVNAQINQLRGQISRMRFGV